MPKAYRSDVQWALKSETEELRSEQMMAALYAALTGVSIGLAVLVTVVRPSASHSDLQVLYWVMLGASAWSIKLNGVALFQTLQDIRDHRINIANFKKALRGNDLL